MMKFSRGVVIVFCAFCAGAYFADKAWAEAIYDGKGRIEVNGKGNTLSSIAADIARADVFSYDPATRTAASSCSIVVAEGAELTVGKEDDAEAGETLKMVCAPELGANSRNVNVKGAFHLYHSRIVGEGARIRKHKSYRLGYGLCYAYNTSSGRIVESSIASASTCIRIYGGSRVSIRNLAVSDCAKGLKSNAGGVIVGLQAKDAACAVHLQRSTQLKDCVFGDSEVVLEGSNRGPPVKVTCTDCRLNRDKIWINGTPGKDQLLIRWRQFFQLINEQDYALEGVYLRLASRTAASSLQPKITKTGAGGEAWLAAPECAIIEAPRGKAYRQVHYTNSVETSAQGTVGSYTVLKTDWLCRENMGWRMVQIGGKRFEGSRIEYRQAPFENDQEVVNLCANSSLEIETIKGIPDYWWPRHFYEMKKHGWGVLRPDSRELVFYGIDRTTAVHGKNSLQVPPGMGRLLVRGFRLDFTQGESHVVSFSAKSDIDDAEISVSTYIGPYRKRFTVGKDWERYSVIWRESDLSAKQQRSARRSASLKFDNIGKSRVWLDAVQVEKGEEVHPYFVDSYKAATH